MPKLAANLSFLFTERPFLERFAAARRGLERRWGMAPGLGVILVGDDPASETFKGRLDDLRVLLRDRLKAGDSVIVDGMARIFFPGAPIQMAPPAPAAASAASK